jgi:hypothetical protein
LRQILLTEDLMKIKSAYQTLEGSAYRIADLVYKTEPQGGER